MKLTLLVITLVFMTSCKIDGNNEKNEVVSSETKLENRTVDSNSGITDFGSGFTLSQTNDKTTLSYSGKMIKIWRHSDPNTIPYLWEEECKNTQKIYETAEKENPNWRKISWNQIPEIERKECIKRYLGNSIRTEFINNKFATIIQNNYEISTYWVYDTISGNLQEMPTMGTLKLTESASGITVFINMTYGDDNMELFYNSDFSKFISKKEIPK